MVSSRIGIENGERYNGESTQGMYERIIYEGTIEGGKIMGLNSNILFKNYLVIEVLSDIFWISNLI